MNMQQMLMQAQKMQRELQKAQDELTEETVEMPKVQNSVEVENNTIGELNKQDDKYEKIAKLKTLLDDNAITQEEYDSEKKKILEEE